MNRNLQRGLFVFLFLALAVAALSWFLMERSRVSEARKQSTQGEFELVGITVSGQTFQEGTALRHAADKFIPYGGVKLGDFELRKTLRHKDRNDAPMTAWLLYRGTSIRAGATPPLFGALAIVKDSSGREFDNPIPSVRRSRTNEMLISIPLVAFPKDEDHFVLRFSPPPLNKREWLEFNIENPLYRCSLTWSLSPFPQTNQVNGSDVILREVTLQPATLAFELPAASWTVEHCTVEDSSGHQLTHTGTMTRTMPNGAAYSITLQPRIETNRLWRIDLGLLNLGAFPPNSRRILQLSLDAPTQNLTNEAGQVFTSTFDGRSLSIAGIPESDPRARRWVITGVTNAATGEPLSIIGGTQSSDPNSRTWPLQPACNSIVVHLAYPELFRTQFYLKPADAPLPMPWQQE